MASFLAAVLISSAAIAQIPQGDTARVVAVSPGIDQEVRNHEPLRFTVTVRYSLTSRDNAFLAVYAERFENGPDGCDHVRRHQTEGGVHTEIKRGEGEVTVHFDWHESPGRLPPGPSFLAIGVNLWREERRGLIAKFGDTFCRPVSP
jgi:hypothetical protein